MSDESFRPAEPPAPATEDDRREFLLRAGKFALTAPAMAVLLQATSKPAHAAGYQTAPVVTRVPA